MAYPQEEFLRVKHQDESFIGQKRAIVFNKTLPYQLEVLKSTGRYDAFKLQWHPTYSDDPNVWPIPNHLFWDSDVAKWIEGACYFLQNRPCSQLRLAVDELVQMIRSAQQPDGYLNIHFTVVEPGKRFTNLRDLHELYNAGHLIEAALAHHHLYGNEELLEPILKYVDLLAKTFGPASGQIHGYPGHPEIELALLRLYNRTKNPKHLQLAQYFIEERGNPMGVDKQHYYNAEAQARRDDPFKRPDYYPERECLWYYQAHKPIVEQDTIEGHSVRAMYLLTAASDLVRMDDRNDNKLRRAVERLWNNMIDKKMYVTGGIGSISQYEGFGQDYFLPQGTDDGGCYAETCAAIGVMMLAQRMLQYDLDGEYSDVMELCFYNAVMTAMSLDGEKFTYVNQLASSNRHPSIREKWFTCACCPPNVLRLLGNIGGYMYDMQTVDEEKTELRVHMYDSSTYTIDHNGNKGVLEQTTDWPWDGKIKFSLINAPVNMMLKLRIPAWASSWQLSPKCADTTIEKGYLTLPPDYLKLNKNFTLDIALKPRLITPHPFTNQDSLTLARGPIIYCVEDMDNSWVTDHFQGLQLDPSCQPEEKAVTDEATGESYISLTVRNSASELENDTREWKSSLVARNRMPFYEVSTLGQIRREARVVEELKFIPYYFRANRGGKGHMRVGLRRWPRQ